MSKAPFHNGVLLDGGSCSTTQYVTGEMIANQEKGASERLLLIGVWLEGGLML